MRMWMVDPQLLCDQHLAGEHVETHMFVGAIRKGTSLRGYVAKGLVETQRLRERHDALAAEMQRRGMRHESALPEFSVDPQGSVDPAASLSELARRCVRCRTRQSETRQAPTFGDAISELGFNRAAELLKPSRRA